MGVIPDMNIIERHLPHGLGSQIPKTIIVHVMAAEIDYEGKRLSAWDLLNKLGWSAHILLSTDGTRTRCRPDNLIAYHAKGFNTNSLGIEILIPGVYNLDQLKAYTAKPYTLPQAQMDVLVQQIMIWKHAHEIESIYRHSDVDPARRWFDPGEGFPWTGLLQRTWSCS